jgi:predicted phosphate transport protein (TIGR00153 family)
MAKFNLIPQETKFYDLFVQSSQNVVEISTALKDLLDNWQDVGTKVARITDLEHKGDTITHQVMDLLYRSFITPFDREDISLLAHTLDDIADFIHAAADAMYIYRIKSPTTRSQELADILVEAAGEVEKAMVFLRSRSELKKAMEYCVDLNRLENEADDISRRALGELFEGGYGTTDIIKWREIYEHMESATDRCEDVANALEGIALKNA